MVVAPFPMLVLHAHWLNRALRLWAESLSACRESPPRAQSDLHSYAVDAEALAAALRGADLVGPDSLGAAGRLRLRLPAADGRPLPSDRLAALLGVIEPQRGSLGTFEVPCVEVRSAAALSALLRLEDRGPLEAMRYGHGLAYWFAVGRFVLELLADQRFIPSLVGDAASPSGLAAAWKPWLNDEAAADRVAALLAAMPPVVRAASTGSGPDGPWRLLHEAIETLCDATVRGALAEADFLEAIRDRDAAVDPQVAWLGGLLGRGDAVPALAGGDEAGPSLLRGVGEWISRLEETAAERPFRLCFRLSEEPPAEGAPADETCTSEGRFSLSMHLLLEGDRPTGAGDAVMIDISRVWSSSPSALLVDGHRIDRPQELLLSEMGRASRIYPAFEAALAGSHPSSLELSPAEAARFLLEFREVLEEAGFAVIAPPWWGTPSNRLGLRLHVESPPEPGRDGASAGLLGLDTLVRYTWRISVGDQVLSAEQIRSLSRLDSPLVRIGGRWVENPAGALARAAALVAADPGGEIPLRRAFRLAQGGDDGAAAGLPVLGMDAGGWVGRVLGLDASGDGEALPDIAQPVEFHGSLRPYQATGLRWLAFLERFGLGACLADDMGLGKTIQLIALLLHERQAGSGVGPTLLVVPTSLIGNWLAELRRFAPTLRAHVHHGPQRREEPLAPIARQCDVVITTYALVPRDREIIGAIDWWRVVLDEAQYIKNPPTRQTTAIRQLRSDRRVALTGTPVENRLAELWSIMEFCNPGYLGPAEEFRRRCAVPIERHRDRERADALRRLVRPFILRRLKSDPKVIVDLPPCVETKEYATLTPEQAALYQQTVDSLLASVDGVDGMARRGRVLAALTRLKQICNHPAHLEAATGAAVAPTGARGLSARSGKARRLVEMLEEIIAAGDKALVFTQYRRMGDLLVAMLREELDREPIFMHGGTPAGKRQAVIDRFQQGGADTPIFVLSLKTGGVGLNLTAANHVFHFDRWWNPAVEKQATDRAYRIGQERTVHVHKFVCVGTLEEQIDQMIEKKTELADHVIPSGEQWITELSTDRLQEVLRLRSSAVEVEP